MRMLGPLLLAAAGCYAPAVTSGAACDPAVGNCPSGQVCTPAGGAFRCEPPGAVVVDADAAGVDAMIDAGADAPPDAIAHRDVAAAVADCVNRVTPDPDACANLSGSSGFLVDMLETGSGDPTDGFVRFDLDADLATRTIVSVTLRLTVTNDARAAGPSSGMIYQVQPFTRATLAISEPAKIGNQPLAPSQGAVVKLMPVTWPLPVTVVQGNSSVFLEIVNTNSDGVIYGNRQSAAPPLLMIDYF